MLGQLLGELGRSGVPECLNELWGAARLGSLPVTPETEEALREACAAVKQMRHSLIRALGLRPK